MARDTPRRPAPAKPDLKPNAFDAEAEGEEVERSSGEYRFVYHEIARITTVRKSVPARKPDPPHEPAASTPSPSHDEPDDDALA